MRLRLIYRERVGIDKFGLDVPENPCFTRVFGVVFISGTQKSLSESKFIQLLAEKIENIVKKTGY